MTVPWLLSGSEITKLFLRYYFVFVLLRQMGVESVPKYDLFRHQETKRGGRERVLPQREIWKMVKRSLVT